MKYAVIDGDAKEAILKKLSENTGYATEITLKYDKRKKQRTARNDAREKREENHDQGNFSLNVSETPETVVSTVPQQASESVVSSTVTPGAGVGAQPFP